MSTLGEIFGSAMAGYRGYTQGATLGLARYPAAAAMMGMDRVAQLVGASKGQLSYDEALQLIRDQDASDRENNPGARMVGEVGGGLASALATGGAGGLTANVARGATQGAVTGFTENAGMDNVGQDMGVGAGLGGVFGGAGKLAADAQSAIVKRAYMARQQGLVERGRDAGRGVAEGYRDPFTKDISYNMTPLGKLLEKGGVSPLTQTSTVAVQPQLPARAVSARRGVGKKTVTGVPASEALAARSTQTVVTSPDEAISKIALATRGKVTIGNQTMNVKDIPASAKREAQAIMAGRAAIPKMERMEGLAGQDVLDAARGPLWQTTKQGGRDLASAVGSTLVPAAGGAAIGAGADVFTGNQGDPWGYAKLGAAAGGGLGLLGSGRSAAFRLGESALAVLPNETAMAAGRLGTTLGTRGAVSALANDRSQAVQPTPWADQPSQAASDFEPTPWSAAAPASSARSSAAAASQPPPSDADFVPVPWK